MQEHIRLATTTGAEPVVYCAGDWTAATAPAIERELHALDRNSGLSGARSISIDDIDNLDTAGAWLLARLGMPIAGGASQHRRLIERISAAKVVETPPRPSVHPLLQPFDVVGRNVMGALRDIFDVNTVQGRILSATALTLTGQARLRFPAFVNQFQQIVLGSIPIVMLISLVVGAIICQQTILQLRNFGATIFVVDLAAILMFREIGILMAAIMIAGRSGSAITAELGSMRMREEFDALRVMGVDPYQALILPRIAALVIGMPLLAFVASMAGLFGAIIVSRFYGDIPIGIFIDRLQQSMTVVSVAVGLIKAPIMGFLIGLVASLEGLKVEGSSESLGRHTTSSVVKAIFIVILTDGLFAIFFAAIRF